MKKKINLSPMQIITIGFLCIVLLGTFLLCLPISSRSGEWTPFVNSMFTAASATCVTGLVAYDTYTHWSVFGQCVIISLIQIGGLGFMSIITLLSFISKRRIGLSERKLIMQSSGSLQMTGVVRLMKKILIGTFMFELTGAILLSIRFVPQMGVMQGILNGFFHSISAFCNAGFDLMGRREQFSSMTGYVHDPLVNLTLIALIIIGGIGFIVWNDIYHYKFKFSKYELHSKIVLATTVVLIVGGTALFWIFENDNTLSGMTAAQKLIASLFQAVSPRTAGFNTVDLSSLSESGSLLTIILMLIGGSPGSTAGGIKTTTFVVMLLSAFAYAGRRDVNLFKRCISSENESQAHSIVTIYAVAIITATMIICAIEPFSFKEVLFEVTSAASTSGLTMGITSKLHTISKLLLILLMYGGRVGGLTLAIVLTKKKIPVPIDRPTENILIG